MSLFIGGRYALNPLALVEEARIGVLTGSILSAVAGFPC
jgi:Na+/H+ antiporter NhaA